MLPSGRLAISAVLLLAAAVTGDHGHRRVVQVVHKCWTPRGVVGTCQSLKTCSITNSYTYVLRSIQTRLCYWRDGQPYICCPSTARGVSSSRDFWRGFSHVRPSSTSATQLPVTTTPPPTPRTEPSTTTASTTTRTPPPTARTTSSTARTPPRSPAAADPARTGHADLPNRQPVPVPPKRLTPPLPPSEGRGATALGQVPMEEKVEDMPTIEPFPMAHKEGTEEAAARTTATPSADGDVESNPVIVADQESADILRETFPDIQPVFAVPGGVFGKEARVAGGFTSVRGRWPWMAVIGKMESPNMTWLCGGSIIDEYHVMTAAHCVLERPNVVRIGDHNIALDFNSGDNSEQHEIAKITMHPKYRPPRSYHDLAIITLKRALQFSRFVRPICLPPPDLRLRRGMTVKITGHGYREFNGGELTSELQEAQIQLVRRKFCNASYSRLGRAFFDKYPGGVLSHMLCAGDKKGGVDACQGDSGGPLMQHDEATNSYHQIGVISSGFGCGNPEYPGLYVSVKHHLNFIRAVTSSHSSRVSADLTEAIRPRR